VEFIETSVFSRQIATLFNDEVYRELQLGLAANPALGKIIRGSGGIRKVRVASSSHGKRGGARVIYFWAVRNDVILLLYCYAKNESANLTPKQVASLSKVVKVVKEEFRNEE
jgi:hypothetical protein